jgi:hypothetical protein
LAKKKPILSIRLQTDRPAYVVGETVRVRFVITNPAKTPVGYDLAWVPDVKVVDAQSKALRKGSIDNVLRMEGPVRRGQFPPGNTALQTYGWRRARVWRQWWDIGSFGYHLGRTDKYTIVADGNLKDYGIKDYTIKASPPVTIRILTRAAARTRPPDLLTDTQANVVLRKSANEYKSLRSALVTRYDILQKYASWDQQRQALQNQIDGLSSSGNPNSPYVQLNANLENAVEALGAAGERAISCDAANEAVDLTVSDYFFRAVRRELSAERANIGDAAGPPQYASPEGYCKVPG